MPGGEDAVAAIDRIADDVFASSDCVLCVLVDSPERAADWRNGGARILLFNSSSILANELQSISNRLSQSPEANNTVRAVDEMVAPTA